MLATLPANYRRTVALRYGLADGHLHELAEIGSELGITGERVCQLLGKAITRLRQHPKRAYSPPTPNCRSVVKEAVTS